MSDDTNRQGRGHERHSTGNDGTAGQATRRHPLEDVSTTVQGAAGGPERRDVLKALGSSPVAKVVGGTAAGTGLFGATTPTVAAASDCPSGPWTVYSTNDYRKHTMHSDLTVRAYNLGQDQDEDVLGGEEATKFLVAIGSTQFAATDKDGDPVDDIVDSHLWVDWDDNPGFAVEPNPANLEDQRTAAWENSDGTAADDTENYDAALEALQMAALGAVSYAAPGLGWVAMGYSLATSVVDALYTSKEESSTFEKFEYQWDDGDLAGYHVSQAHYLHYIKVWVDDNSEGSVRLTDRVNDNGITHATEGNIELEFTGQTNHSAADVNLQSSSGGPDTVYEAYPEGTCGYWAPEELDKQCPMWSGTYTETDTLEHDCNYDPVDPFNISWGADFEVYYVGKDATMKKKYKDYRWFHVLLTGSQVTYDPDTYELIDRIRASRLKFRTLDPNEEIVQGRYWVDQMPVRACSAKTISDDIARGFDVSAMRRSSNVLDAETGSNIDPLLVGDDVARNLQQFEEMDDCPNSSDEDDYWCLYKDSRLKVDPPVRCGPQMHASYACRIGLPKGESVNYFLEAGGPAIELEFKIGADSCKPSVTLLNVWD